MFENTVQWYASIYKVNESKRYAWICKVDENSFSSETLRKINQTENVRGLSYKTYIQCYRLANLTSMKYKRIHTYQM